MIKKPKSNDQNQPNLNPINWAKYVRGLGKSVWKDIDIDKYISNLREEWRS